MASIQDFKKTIQELNHSDALTAREILDFVIWMDKNGYSVVKYTDTGINLQDKADMFDEYINETFLNNKDV